MLCLSCEKDDSIAELQFKSYQDMFSFLLQALNYFYNSTTMNAYIDKKNFLKN